MDTLGTVRKVILCVGILVAALLFLYPHWKASFYSGGGVPTFEGDLGRNFIVSPPIQFTLAHPNIYVKAVARINYARQFTEVVIALLATFGLRWALRKPKGIRTKDPCS